MGELSRSHTSHLWWPDSGVDKDGSGRMRLIIWQGAWFLARSRLTESLVYHSHFALGDRERGRSNNRGDTSGYTCGHTHVRTGSRAPVEAGRRAGEAEGRRLCGLGPSRRARSPPRCPSSSGSRAVRCTPCTWAAPCPCPCWRTGTACWCCWKWSARSHSHTARSARMPSSSARISSL